MATDDSEWDQHHRVVRDRLNWTAVISNAALIVAIVGGAMQSSDASAVLKTFASSLVLFGVGAGIGLLGAELALFADIEWKRGTAWWEDPEGPAKELAALHARAHEISSPQLLVENFEEMKRIAARVQDLVPLAEKGGAESRAKVVRSIRLNRFATAGRLGSMVLCAGGFVWLIVSVHAFWPSSPLPPVGSMRAGHSAALPETPSVSALGCRATSP